MIKYRIIKNNINNLFQKVPLKNTKFTQAQMECVLNLIKYEFKQSLTNMFHQLQIYNCFLKYQFRKN